MNASTSIHTARESIASKLNGLHEHNKNEAALGQNIDSKSLVTIANGEVAQTASAHSAGLSLLLWSILAACLASSAGE
jgi:hypothetical protein